MVLLPAGRDTRQVIQGPRSTENVVKILKVIRIPSRFR